MNSERLLAHFDQVADAPDAVPRLRRFVLDLAVRGKLVEQDPADEPVSELLKRIAADKKERSESARGRSSTLPKLHDVIQLPFEVPSNWVCASLGGITISRDRERIPVSRAERQTRAKIYDYYGASGVIDKIDGYLFDKPLLVIGEDGANLINRSSPIAFIAKGKYWVNNHAHVLDGIDEDFLRYLELFINATDLKPFVTGTAQPKMNQTNMNSIRVALPPVAEQNRIIEKIDELMALCDRLEEIRAAREDTRDRLAKASYARLNVSDADDMTLRTHARFAVDTLRALTIRPDRVKSLRQTILDLAVRGKLVDQDQTEEPASELLERIEAERGKVPNTKRRRSYRIKVEAVAEDLYDLPTGWEWVSIGTVFLYDAGIKREPRALDSSRWLLELGDIEKDTGRLLSRVTGAERSSKSTKSEFQLGDILYGKLRPYLNKVLVADEPGYSTTEIVAIRPYVPLCSEYCSLALRRPDFVKYVTRLGQGTKMPRLRTTDAIVAPFPLPPIAEQHRIVAKVHELMALCDRLETNLGTADTSRHRLLESLLREALKPTLLETETAE